ncbi:MAG TPA: hypothetical protein VMB03_01970 [Bryobacteraceae bacterium]|nr:hypothetical protein [Bryobacteraceae bacterium]
MLRFSALVLVVCGAACGAQLGDDGTVIAAKSELARVQGLVAAGALPRASIEKAQDAVADAEDATILRHTAYGELTVDQADDMLAAARRRLDRRQKARDEAAKLVDAGAAPKASLDALDSEVEDERREVSLVKSRAELVHELAESAEAEGNHLEKLARSPAEARELTAGYTPDGTLIYANYAKVEVAFHERFGKPMPVSAMGETAVHRAMGFDHRGRVDVALNPDQPEGAWLIEYLKQNHIPFIAFRGPVPGKATGAHIHIGPMSTRLASGG